MAEPNEFNKKIIDEFHANAGVVGAPFAGMKMILITTKGAKTGQVTTTPLVYSKDGERIVIIASMGGAPKSPAWYHNLVANPEVEVEVGTEKFTVVASEAKGAERDSLFAKQAAVMPAFAEYEKKTTRKIPLMLLTRKV